MSSPTVSIPVESGFDAACRRVLDFLHDRLPLDFWTVSRVIDGRQVYLEVTPNDLGLGVGDGPAWAESMCQVMWESHQPQVVPDISEVPAYAEREASLSVPVAAYVGIPLLNADGSLFGTMCGIDKAPQPERLVEAIPLLEVLGDLLSTVMNLDSQATDMARSLEATRIDAETDALTGLRNRRGWQAVCDLEEARHHRLGDQASILIIDLDDLKVVNDRDGHAGGDELIKRAARVLQDGSRGTDTVARLGGDEFGVLCPQTTATDAHAIAERLRAELVAASVAASVGVATMEQARTLAQTEAEADRAMYVEKRSRPRV